MPKRSTPAVSSFGPELLALLLKGAKEEVHILLPTKKEARRLHFRLNSLRKAMREEIHFLYTLVEKVEIHTKRFVEDEKLYGDGNGKTRVVVSPADNSFAEVIRAAGVDVDEELSQVEGVTEGGEDEREGNYTVQDEDKEITMGLDGHIEGRTATAPVLDEYLTNFIGETEEDEEENEDED